MKIKLLVLGFFTSTIINAQKLEIPAVHSNIIQGEGMLMVEYDGGKATHVEYLNPLLLNNIRGKIAGTASGLFFDFNDKELEGKMVFGLIPFGDSKHPQPVYYSRSAQIKTGKTAINIKNQLRGRYDMVGWEKSGKGVIGYRIINDKGNILYDGQIAFKGTGPFKIDDTILEGPFVNLLTDKGATISFDTNNELKALVTVEGKEFKSKVSGLHHEIKLTGLSANKNYDYVVTIGDNQFNYSFKTAPIAGKRTKFSFAYASDSRGGNGGGERNISGANVYITKKIMALATQQGTAFMQFTGDMIGGYKTAIGEMDLQYASWKRAIQPFAHYMPVIATMGNHEALMRMFQDDKKSFRIDRFPYDTESSEAVFARHFVNPLNGPDSEDGAKYDPNKRKTDFPTYKENVFYYTYDNVAMINLNSDYWYSPSTREIPIVSGGLHGYIMDQQLEWLEETIMQLEKDETIDHIFVTQHTPCFPNGGHVRDDMWYGGNNDFRPYVAGKPLKKGIIERRDELLDLLINKSKKTRAILTGDEHNYAKTEVGPNTIIYDDKWEMKKLELTRTIYQINNGAAGAPYYAQEQTPWSSSVSGFTTQNALVLFHVDGDSIEMEVLNPDTLEKVDELKVR
ncbi:MAG: metallophosphoesterase [Bacteroidota bacterium]